MVVRFYFLAQELAEKGPFKDEENRGRNKDLLENG